LRRSATRASTLVVKVFAYPSPIKICGRGLCHALRLALALSLQDLIEQSPPLLRALGRSADHGSITLTKLPPESPFPVLKRTSRTSRTSEACGLKPTSPSKSRHPDGSLGDLKDLGGR
jgi:hypothetical protein